MLRVKIQLGSIADFKYTFVIIKSEILILKLKRCLNLLQTMQTGQVSRLHDKTARTITNTYKSTKDAVQQYVTVINSNIIKITNSRQDVLLLNQWNTQTFCMELELSLIKFLSLDLAIDKSFPLVFKLNTHFKAPVTG